MHKQQLKLKTANPQPSAAAALRAQLELEIQNKKQCLYEPYECTQLSLDGYKFCLKHILNDKTAPYKQCSYIYQNNGKRCYLPAPKSDKKECGYCNEHALKTTLLRNRQNSKFPPPHSSEGLLNSLEHYVKKPKRQSLASIEPEEGQDLKATKSFDPFTEIDTIEVFNSKCNDILDLCSESDSDIEPSTYSSVWHDAQDDSSDNESIDSEVEDPLKHANVFTAEEITQIARDKLVRLQSLYIEQYRHLQHVMKEKRRRYIHALRREKETCGNIYNQVRDNIKEQRLYKKLKYYNQYNRTFGEEAILSKRLHDIRTKISDGVSVKPHSSTKCSFTEGGFKCSEKAIPLAKHCRKHILEDQNQILFKPCARTNGDIECSTPVEAIFDDSTCRLHLDIPALRSYNQPRKESESDTEDTLDLPPEYTIPSSEGVKTELIDYSIPTDIPKMDAVPTMLFEDDEQDNFLFNDEIFANEANDVEIDDHLDLQNDTDLQQFEDSIEENVIVDDVTMTDNIADDETIDVVAEDESQIVETSEISQEIQVQEEVFGGIQDESIVAAQEDVLLQSHEASMVAAEQEVLHGSQEAVMGATEDERLVSQQEILSGTEEVPMEATHREVFLGSQEVSYQEELPGTQEVLMEAAQEEVVNDRQEGLILPTHGEVSIESQNGLTEAVQEDMSVENAGDLMLTKDEYQSALNKCNVGDVDIEGT